MVWLKEWPLFRYGGMMPERKEDGSCKLCVQRGCRVYGEPALLQRQVQSAAPTKTFSIPLENCHRGCLGTISSACWYTREKVHFLSRCPYCEDVLKHPVPSLRSH